MRQPYSGEPKEFRVRYKTEEVPGMEKSHIHRDLELAMVLSDQVNCTIGTVRRTLQANTLVLFNNFERHCLNVPGRGYRRYTCLFLPSFLGADGGEDLLACFFVRPTSDSNIMPLAPEEAARFRMLLDEMERVARLPEDSYARRRELQLLLKVLLVEVNRRHRAQCGLEQPAGGAYTLVSQVAARIQEDLASPELSLEMLARRFAVSRTRLAADFKAVTGTTLHQYLMDCRVWQAAQLLEQGTPVEEAGAAVGFAATAHFSRSFKARVGQSPKRYAMAHKKAEREKRKVER